MTGSILPSRARGGEVDAVLLQRLERALRVGAGDPLRAADRLSASAQRGRRHAVLPEHVGDLAALVGQREQQVLGRRRTRRSDRGPRARRRSSTASKAARRLRRGHRRARRGRQLVDQPLGSRRATASGSAPTACSSGRVSASASSSSATARWAGSTAGLPRSAAVLTAAETACWLRVVRSMGMWSPHQNR